MRWLFLLSSVTTFFAFVSYADCSVRIRIENREFKIENDILFWGVRL